MTGVQTCALPIWVRVHYPDTITLVLTAHDRDAYLAEMIDAGSAGFLLKGTPPDRLVTAIRCAARGDALFTVDQLRRAQHWREEVRDRWKSLTGRERQVLELLIEGLGNGAIARRLCLTVSAVEGHLTSIMRKLGVSSRLAAAMWVQTYVPDEFKLPPGEA